MYRDAKAGIIQAPIDERKLVLLAIKRLSQGRFPRVELMRSNHAHGFGRLVHVQRISQHGRLVWSIDINRLKTPVQVRLLSNWLVSWWTVAEPASQCAPAELLTTGKCPDRW